MTMGNTKTVFLVVIAVAAITSSVLVASSRITTESLPRPPRVTLNLDNTVVEGVLGSYCQTAPETQCLDKLEPSQITTRAALIAEEIANQTTMRFSTPDGDEPTAIQVTIRDGDGKTFQSFESQSFTTTFTPGVYLVVAETTWPAWNATYIYQIEVESR